MACVDDRRELVVIREVATFDSPADLGCRKLARIERDAARTEPPHETDALDRLARRRERLGPRIGEERRIDVVDAAIRIDVGARKFRFEERRAGARHVRPQSRDVRILRLPQEASRRPMIEIVRICLA